MQKVRVGVVGVGYLGSLHADKFSQMEGVELSCIVDTCPETRLMVSTKHKVQGYEDFHDVVDMVDAVSIATPTVTHYEIARFFLEAGKDVFVEKPISATLGEAEELVSLAKEKNLILQVGHLERFNGAYTKVLPYIKRPLFVESERIGPFKERGLDVDVVLDLMIHDIDLAAHLVGSEVKDVRAVGAPVLTGSIDMAQAWIEFENGAVSSVKASRVSRESVRKLRVFQEDGYISIDFLGKKATFIKKESWDYEVFSGVDVDPLMEELKSFIECVAERKTPLVSGEDGLRALRIAEMIKKDIEGRLKELYEA